MHLSSTTLAGTPSHSDILDLCGLLGFLSPVAMGMGGAENVSPEDVRTATDASVRCVSFLSRGGVVREDDRALRPCQSASLRSQLRPLLRITERCALGATRTGQSARSHRFDMFSHQPRMQRCAWALSHAVSKRISVVCGHARRSLVHGLTLRRTRAEVEDQLDLPPCVREDVHVDMSLSERRLYIPLTVEFNQALQVIKAKMQGDSHTDTSEVQRQLEALRQCCCHPGMVGEVTEWRGVRETLGRIVLEVSSVP